VAVDRVRVAPVAARARGRVRAAVVVATAAARVVRARPTDIPTAPRRSRPIMPIPAASIRTPRRAVRARVRAAATGVRRDRVRGVRVAARAIAVRAVVVRRAAAIAARGVAVADRLNSHAAAHGAFGPRVVSGVRKTRSPTRQSALQTRARSGANALHAAMSTRARCSAEARWRAKPQRLTDGPRKTCTSPTSRASALLQTKRPMRWPCASGRPRA
jgi:hypothetical protein